MVRSGGRDHRLAVSRAVREDRGTQAEETFANAWADPTNTRIELPPVDVNAVLSDGYETSAPLTFTRTMMWDTEVRKAWWPDVYIPSVVEEGSASAWQGDPRATGFVRMSRQRLWLEPERHELVLERVHLNPAERRVTFLGTSRLAGPDGAPLRAGGGQPLFHVEHAVAGEESRPLSLWRVVHLTERPDARLTAAFQRPAPNLGGVALGLPEFIEIYIREDLGLDLTRRATRSDGVATGQRPREESP